MRSTECLISFLQLAAFCQQFIKEMCYVMFCYSSLVSKFTHGLRGGMHSTECHSSLVSKFISFISTLQAGFHNEQFVNVNSFHIRTQLIIIMQ